MRDEEDIPADLSTLIRLGTVIEVTLSPPRCRVRYGDPDGDNADTETPPIRWLSGRAGKTRKWSPPSLGEEVLLLAPDGQIGNAVALTGLINDGNPAPSEQDLEHWEFEDGAKISYDPGAHALVALLPADSSARLEAKTITLVGDVTVQGKMHVTQDAQFDTKLNASGKITSSDDVVAGNISLKTHKTSGVTPGSGTSQVPIP